MALLGERHSEIEGCRGLRDAALLVGERDHLTDGHGPQSPMPWELIRACIRRHHGESFALSRATRCHSEQLTSAPLCADLLERRLIFVTGKGGVGKSTVATALGLLGARSGLRTIVAELASQDRVGQSVRAGRGDLRGGRARRRAVHDLDRPRARDGGVPARQDRHRSARRSARAACSTRSRWRRRECASCCRSARSGSWRSCNGATERRRRLRPRDRRLARGRPRRSGILHTPRTFAEIARVGPIAHQAETIAHTIADRQFTSVVAVSTAPRCPSTKRCGCATQLRADGLALDAVIVNALYPDRFSDDERELLERARTRSRSPLTTAALGAALSEHARARSQAEQLQRLRDGLGPAGPPLVTLPYLFAEAIGPGEIKLLTNALDKPAVRPVPGSRRLTRPLRARATALSARPRPTGPPAARTRSRHR